MFEPPDRARTTCIYALVDPRQPDIIKYVGKSKHPRIRHLQHCAVLEYTSKGEWIDTIRNEGILPQITILDWTEGPRSTEAEEYWVRKLRCSELTNDTYITKIAKRGMRRSHVWKPIKIAQNYELLQKTLVEVDWDMKKAARKLNTTINTCYRIIAEWVNLGTDPEDEFYTAPTKDPEERRLHEEVRYLHSVRKSKDEAQLDKIHAIAQERGVA